MAVVHIPGKNSGHIMLYALSTCGWCQKTKKLLDDLGVAYDYEYVDHLDGDEREKAIKEIAVWNPSCSFPTVVINSETCIVGYKEDEIREALRK
ncbi:MAG: glutaredoxin family protein [Dehalococcoidales bacterium]|nr:glutaredoxin family protein [Dehalococcoidales bacterium]